MPTGIYQPRYKLITLGNHKHMIMQNPIKHMMYHTSMQTDKTFETLQSHWIAEIKLFKPIFSD